jgi:hypothetical protein
MTERARTLATKTLADIQRDQHAELIAAGGLTGAMDRLDEALAALRARFSEELGDEASFGFDWTYHGADPVKAEVFRVAEDLRCLILGAGKPKHVPTLRRVRAKKSDD